MTLKNNQENGIIVKALSGFYYVETASGVLECRARGVFKKRGISPVVGDRVTVERSEDTPVISEIAERHNVFTRPPVANIDQFVVVSALHDPDPNFAVIDKFLVNAEANGVGSILCFNKKDLAEDSQMAGIKAVYGKIYPLIFADARSEEGLDDLVPYLAGNSNALIGPSGVGKSTIINALRGDSIALTGEISARNRRGRNTTRHVELFMLKNGGNVFDTPGFTSFDITEDISEVDLQYFYPEFEKYIGSCRFNGCRHLSEPGCAVRSALAEGSISRERYESYCSRIEEIRERERKRY